MMRAGCPRSEEGKRLAQQRSPRRLAALLIAGLAGLLSCPPDADAQTSGGQRASSRASTPVFTYRDEKIIREYFADYPGEIGLTPTDPPAAQPAKGQRLRPASERRALPRDLAIRLKPLPKGYQRVIVDNDVLIVSARTATIADVLLDAW